MKSHSEAYTSNTFLLQFPELVLSRKGNLAKLCELAGLQQESIVGPPQLIPFEKFIRLLEVAAEQLDFPDLAVALAERQDINILGPISAMLLGVEDGPDAIEQVRSSLKLLISNVEIDLLEDDHNVEIRFRPNLPLLQERPQFQIYLLAGTSVFVKEMLGQAAPFRGCFFQFQEESEATVRSLSNYFRCPVAFGSPKISLTLRKELFEVSTTEVNHRLQQRLRTELDNRSNISDQVTQVIVQCLPGGNAKVENVAQALGYSPRTLHRRLEDSATSFNALLQSARLQMANQYLNNHYYSLADVAHLLGYKNLSAFSRSYKSWCGVTPSSVRNSKA